MTYGMTQVIHLLCATAFIGVVFFEVFILEGIRNQTDPAVMRQIQEGIVARAKRIMPWIVATLFFSGIGMAWFHYARMPSPFESAFGILLGIKILLAISVLAHFICKRSTNHTLQPGVRLG